MPSADSRAAQLVTRSTIARARLWNWDALRFVATFDIVALHTTASHGVFGVGLPLYLLMTCALGARAGRSAGAERRARGQRLLLPYAFGWLFYAGVRSLEAWREGQPLLGWFEPAQLLHGPRVHLWFLPYACVLGAIMAALAPWLRRVPAVVVGALLVTLSVVLGWVSARAPAVWPLSQWTFSLPALALGFALHLRVARGARAPMVACVLALAWLTWIDPSATPVVPRFLGASCLLLLALELPQWQVPGLARLTPALLGVYIVHPFVFTEWVHDSLWKLGLGRSAAARAGGTFVLSLLVSLVLRALWRRVRAWRRARLSLSAPAEII